MLIGLIIFSNLTIPLAADDVPATGTRERKEPGGAVSAKVTLDPEKEPERTYPSLPDRRRAATSGIFKHPGRTEKP
jgi:hypothetical protein